MKIDFPESSRGRAQSHDYSSFKGAGVDDVVAAVVKVLRDEMEGERKRSTSIVVISEWMKGGFLPWLIKRAATNACDIGLLDISRDLLDDYLRHARATTTYVNAGRARSKVIAIIAMLHAQNYVGPVEELRPRVHFPMISKFYKAQSPYSAPERKLLRRALAKDINAIRAGTFRSAAPAEAISLYLFELAFKSGFNETPLMELDRDEGLKPHPVKKGAWILGSYKWRGSKSVSIDAGALPDPRTVRQVEASAASLFNEIRDLTNPLVGNARDDHKSLLFLRPPLKRKRKDRPDKPSDLHMATFQILRASVSRIGTV